MSETDAKKNQNTELTDAAESWTSWFINQPLTVILAILLFVLVNYLSSRHYKRWDWTKHQLYTLSPQTLSIARSLRQPLDIYVLLSKREPQYRDVYELVERYGAASSKIHVHTIDPDLQPERFIELVRELGIRTGRSSISEITSEAAVVIRRDSNHWEINRDTLGLRTPDPENPTNDDVQIDIERAITEGLIKIDNPNQSTRICVAAGHGELALEGQDDSMSSLMSDLRHANFNPEVVQIQGSVTIPSRCSALLIARPQSAYTRTESDAVVRYLRSGGNAMLMIDPMFVNGRWVPTGLEAVAALGGIELTSTLIVEPNPANRIEGTLPSVFFSTEFGDHIVSRTLRGAGARILVTVSRGLRQVRDSTVMPEVLIRTTNDAWGETGTIDEARDGTLQKDPQDLGGPVAVAMASQIPNVARPSNNSEQAAGRLIVVGYSHFATNEAFDRNYMARFADGAFAELAVSWLVERRELINVPPKPAASGALRLSKNDVWQIQIYSILLVPLAAALVGYAVHRARKQQ